MIISHALEIKTAQRRVLRSSHGIAFDNKEWMRNQSRKEYKKEWRLKNIVRIRAKEKAYDLLHKNRASIFSRRLQSIKARCNNPNSKDFKYYGGRGIKCLLTLNDLKYIWMRDNAEKLKNPSIDRIDPEGSYDLNNSRFIEIKENLRRKRKRGKAY